ncbi:AAA family ATPase [Roseomonas fluvialis]|uniref:Transcriptional regulator n=1 Tax=Roseomonas fluvialis TaxID=1750527 RepID=A0ABM7Y2F9_9PROT|nr:cellulose synthase operon protein YhjQ/BcsQ [Roseomonas fluvialis]BDG72039.1 transcriptional regulator [Roseomonas fluvialis]
MAGVDGPDRNAPATAQASAPSADRAPLIAFVTDAESDAILRETLLTEMGEGAEVRRGDIVAATKALKRSSTPLALVVDVSGVEQPLTALEELALVVEPDVRVLVIGERTDAAFYRQLTRGLGVLEYLFKPLSQEMVARHLLPYLRQGSTQRDMHLRGGRVITVTGVRGGVGATTIAANLAWHLGEEARRHTVLYDADLHAGASALLLGARTTNGLRAALEHPERVDELFVERTAQPVGERLHVLAAEEKPGEAVLAQPGAAARLITMLRRRYNFVVVDLPARSAPAAREVLDMAHQRILVTDPSLAGAREMLRYAAIPNAPTQSRRAFTVLNNLGKPGLLTAEQVKEAMGEDADLVIPWLPKVVPVSADLGEAAAAKRGPFRSALLKLVQEVASIRAEGEEEQKRGIFARWFR